MIKYTCCMEPALFRSVSRKWCFYLMLIGTCIPFTANTAVLGQSIQSNAKEILVLYDASQGTNPDLQGWSYLSNRFGSSTVVRYTDQGVHRLNTTENIDEMAGYFGTGHPLIGRLDRHKGFSLIVNLRLLDDVNRSDDRGGFSVIVLSSDLLGAEVVFRKDMIWVYSESFEAADQIWFDTSSQFVEYSIYIHGDEYTISAANTPILTGPLKDYSGSGIPYDVSDFLFFGDNTSRSGADVLISGIELHHGYQHDHHEKPETATLYQNYPNPFTQSTTIQFELESSGRVKLEVFDIRGRKAATLLDDDYDSGLYRVPFDAHGLSSGIYIYRLTTHGQVFSKKMVLTGGKAR